MKILVTGGCGFIGSHITDGYIKKGHQVVVADNLSTGDIKNLNALAKFVKLDVADEKIESVFKKEKFDAVNHHAAQINVRTSVVDPLFDARVNILGTLNLLRSCARFRVKKFIFASSGGAIYGEPRVFPITEDFPINPLSPYGVSKSCAETYVRTMAQFYNFEFVILRYSNVYGPRQISKSEAGVISIFIDQILNDRQCIVFGNGKQIRDYVYVSDVVGANLRALTSKPTILNIGTGIGTSVNDLIDIFGDLLSHQIAHRHAAPRPGEVFKNVLDASKARKHLRWRPRIVLEKGILETFQYFKAKRR